jgi:hypothetical protein
MRFFLVDNCGGKGGRKKVLEVSSAGWICFWMTVGHCKNPIPLL